MKNPLPKILQFLTGHKRHKVPDLKWNDVLISYNLFRIWELLFWRRNGKSNNEGDTIRIESAYSWGQDEDGIIHISRTFYTWESMIVHAEGTFRNYLKRI